METHTCCGSGLTTLLQNAFSESRQVGWLRFSLSNIWAVLSELLLMNQAWSCQRPSGPENNRLTPPSRLDLSVLAGPLAGLSRTSGHVNQPREEAFSSQAGCGAPGTSLVPALQKPQQLRLVAQTNGSLCLPLDN